MEAILFYAEDENQLNQLLSFSKEKDIKYLQLNEDEKRKLGGIFLANLANKNSNAYATDEEIISVVEEVRKERYGKGLESSLPTPTGG
ncbi:MAG: hypothetical protein ABIP79_04210 [Chitinophagaceae bacterium]